MAEPLFKRLDPSEDNALFALIDSNRPALHKFWWEPKTKTPADSRQFITSVNQLEADNGAPTRGIYVDEKLVGVCALHTIDWEARRSLLGFWMDKEQTGKGYGHAIMKELARLAFDELDLQEIRIVTNEQNTVTRNLAERSGFSLVEVVDRPEWEVAGGDPVSTAIYALARS
jgi:ribosomal-protein-serine acetyltransferase